MAFIEVDCVSKSYRIVKNRPGILGSVASLFHREYNIKNAVDNISFSIGQGEIVGYIGPNGAGKSTTIKMLSGVLIPDSGEIRVGGIVPYRERKKNAMRIGVVFGQRSQLYWDLPISDTFGLFRRLYEIPDDVYEHNKRLYVELLGMEDFIEQPVRQLSLGQKMKANLALAMLHNPDVLYLDEPTIGLDVMSKQVLRQSIAALNREKNTTIILTTHDMNDIEAVCKRLILIDKGRKLFDGGL
ncbi:MAG: ATP-binding cassette domain-containing protein, partial [Treponema sp.]|nr:ATP-binding cassette domain-containing protein [Treponema sp.]